MARHDIPGLILGSGLSRRMGDDKTEIRLGGTPLLEHIALRLAPQVATLAVNLPTGHPLSGNYPNIPDTRPDRPGPLAGVLAGMQAFAEAADRLLTAPVDAPFLPRDLVERMVNDASLDEIVVAASNGREHPVVALWPTGLAKDLHDWLADPQHRRVRDFIHRHPFRIVPFPEAERADGRGRIDPFFNINTPADLNLAGEIVEGGGA